MYPSLKASLHALLLQNKQWNPNQPPRNKNQDPDQMGEVLQEVVFTAVRLMTETLINVPAFLAHFMPEEQYKLRSFSALFLMTVFLKQCDGYHVIVASLSATEAAFLIPPPVLCLLPGC